MYFSNVQDINGKIGCNKKMANYLIKNGAIVLGCEGNTYYFSDTDKVKSLIENSPLHIKFIGKVVKDD